MGTTRANLVSFHQCSTGEEIKRGMAETSSILTIWAYLNELFEQLQHCIRHITQVERVTIAIFS